MQFRRVMIHRNAKKRISLIRYRRRRLTACMGPLRDPLRSWIGTKRSISHTKTHLHNTLHTSHPSRIGLTRCSMIETHWSVSISTTLGKYALRCWERTLVKPTLLQLVIG